MHYFRSGVIYVLKYVCVSSTAHLVKGDGRAGWLGFSRTCGWSSEVRIGRLVLVRPGVLAAAKDLGIVSEVTE